MLRNYFKIAIAVLKRRKFFTFISLFGISFTLTILMLATALADKMFSSDYPDLKRERSLYVQLVELRNSKEGWINQGSASFYFLDHYARTLKYADKIAISSYSSEANTYVNNKKLTLEYKYTNAEYWQVMEYQFLEGKSFNAQEIANAAHVAVISEDTRNAYFGNAEKVTGKYIELDNTRYKVIGVVRNVASTLREFFGDVYLPYTVSKSNLNDHGLTGDYNAVLLAKRPQDVPLLKAEFAKMVTKIPNPDKEMDQVNIHADSYFESYAREIAGSGTDSGVATLIGVVALVVLLFLLLPTINLISINITRIMERSSEIGVRKAFGASGKVLVYQFLVENLILTFLGGLIGVILSLIGIWIFNTANIIPNINLTLNYKVLGYGLLVCIIFGLLSGVYPAWRMSRLNVVKALKSQ